MGHFEGKDNREVFVDDEGNYWNSESMNISLDPKTWGSIDVNEPIPAKEKKNTQPEKSEMRIITRNDSEEQARTKLMAIKYHRLCDEFDLPKVPRIKKEMLVDKIMTEKLGYGGSDSTDTDQPGN